MARRKGFTLLELLIVIILIVILAGVTVAMMNTFFRGQGTRQAATQVVIAFSNAKQLAANTRVMHFLVFFNVDTTGDGTPESGTIEIHKDVNGNRQYDGDFNSTTMDADTAIEGKPMALPKHVKFESYPQWVGVFPTGYCTFPAGFSEMNGGPFDGLAQNGTVGGDIILLIPGRNYRACLDIDRGSGKIRRWFFTQQ